MSHYHLVLLGDSIFDNQAYVAGGPAVIDHLRAQLPDDWRATLIARDGDLVRHVEEQLRTIPEDATHLVLSVGGNDALHAVEVLARPADTVRTAVLHLHEVRARFRRDYRAALWRLQALNRPLAVCTIYDAVPGLTPDLVTTLCIFNDSIVREANAAGVPVIDLRCVCTEAGDYSEISPIEPSDAGGGKIAQAIVKILRQAAGQREGR